MSRAEIEASIPHRDPFLLLDEVALRTDDMIVCRKTFTGDEYFFAGHYPGFPLVPGVLLCEACMQAGAVLLSNLMAGEGGIPVATRMNEVKFKKTIHPGDAIDIDVKINERLQDTFFMTGKVTCGGKLAVRLDFACTVISKSSGESSE